VHKAIVVAIAVATVSGCVATEWSYVASQAGGQIDVLARAEPIERVLRRDNLDADTRRKLRLVQAVVRFAEEELGLEVGERYRTVSMLPREATVYVVTAAPTGSLDAIRWSYPWVGELPYRGFFSRDEAVAFAASLAQPDLETDVRGVSTYSLLGLWADPLLSPVLDDDEAIIVETVIHELTHATVFAAGQGAFNEGLATFVGREGRRQFLRKTLGDDSAAARRAYALDTDDDAFRRAVSSLAFDLRLLFAEAGRHRRSNKGELERARQRIFADHQRHWSQEVAPTLTSWHYRIARLPGNNASLAAVALYTLRQHLYATTFDAVGRDLRRLMVRLRAVSTEQDPQQALELWLQGKGSGGR
jgi:predicted aminopeptidase